MLDVSISLYLSSSGPPSLSQERMHGVTQTLSHKNEVANLDKNLSISMNFNELCILESL